MLDGVSGLPGQLAASEPERELERREEPLEQEPELELEQRHSHRLDMLLRQEQKPMREELMEQEPELELERYSRQVRFAPIGEAGQRRLRAGRALIVGAGALGASLAQHLARAGVGEVRLADRDYVEPSNLQRQMLFDEADARDALPKAVAAAEKLRRINSGVRVIPAVRDVNARTVRELIRGVDVVLDGTDNAATRLLLSDECFRLGIPLLYGGVTGSQGMCASLVPGRTACLRCLIGGEDAPEGDTCDTVGVISPAVDFIASLQAAEALKWLSGSRDAVRTTWISADVWSFRLRESRLPGGSAGCPHCGAAAERAAAGRAAAAVGAAAGPAAMGGACVEPAAAGGSAAGPAAQGGAASAEAARQAADAEGGTPAHKTAGRLPFAAAADSGSDERPYLADVPPVALCGRDTVQVSFEGPFRLEKLRAELAGRGFALTANPYLLRAELPEGERFVLFPDGRVLVQGTSDAERAVALCRRYLAV